MFTVMLTAAIAAMDFSDLNGNLAQQES